LFEVVASYTLALFSFTYFMASASTSPAGSVGVPSLNISDLDSSTGSLSSSNEESFSQRAGGLFVAHCYCSSHQTGFSSAS